jgi:hypothetical protein
MSTSTDTITGESTSLLIRELEVGSWKYTTPGGLNQHPLISICHELPSKEHTWCARFGS